ncbi:hypothetical protein ACM66B_001846 [Microbotryomycetes sp. NB124-2]
MDQRSPADERTRVQATGAQSIPGNAVSDVVMDTSSTAQPLSVQNSPVQPLKDDAQLQTTSQSGLNDDDQDSHVTTGDSEATQQIDTTPNTSYDVAAADVAQSTPSTASAKTKARAQPQTSDSLANELEHTHLEQVADNQHPLATASEAASFHTPIASPPPPPPPQSEAEEEWPLKQIAWPPLPPPPSDSHGETTAIEQFVKIVCQNANGPCSLIALCNILILRGDIVIEPSRNSATYSYLSNLIANHLLSNATSTTSVSVEKVLEILPSTRYGLNLNPRFGSIDGFKQSQGDEATGTGELDLFATSKAPLLHGWVVDPQDSETWDVVVEKAGDYDNALEKVVAGQEIAGGDVDDGEQDESKVLAMVQKRSLWTPEQEDAVRQAHVIKRFLTSSQTQLTYHGLFLLSTQLAPSSLSALFRNSHLSVLYRRLATPTPHNTPQLGSEGPALFTLVTDATFVHEPEVVWESLEDVEGALSEFYDGALRKTSVRGGEYVRSSAPRDEARRMRQEQERMERWRREEAEQMQVEEFSRQAFETEAGVQDRDLALAQRIQAEEDERAWQAERERRRRERAHEAALAAESAPAVLAPGALSVGPTAVSQPPADGPGKQGKKDKDKSKEKKDKDKCIVS